MYSRSHRIVHVGSEPAKECVTSLLPFISEKRPALDVLTPRCIRVVTSNDPVHYCGAMSVARRVSLSHFPMLLKCRQQVVMDKQLCTVLGRAGPV